MYCNKFIFGCKSCGNGRSRFCSNSFGGLCTVDSAYVFTFGAKKSWRYERDDHRSAERSRRSPLYWASLLVDPEQVCAVKTVFSPGAIRMDLERACPYVSTRAAFKHKGCQRFSFHCDTRLQGPLTATPHVQFHQEQHGQQVDIHTDMNSYEVLLPKMLDATLGAFKMTLRLVSFCQMHTQLKA